jgi:hypothetical protein
MQPPMPGGVGVLAGVVVGGGVDGGEGYFAHAGCSVEVHGGVVHRGRG